MTQERPIPAVRTPKMANSRMDFQMCPALHSFTKCIRKTAARGNAITATFNLVIIPKPNDKAIRMRFFRDLCSIQHRAK